MTVLELYNFRKQLKYSLDFLWKKHLIWFYFWKYYLLIFSSPHKFISFIWVVYSPRLLFFFLCWGCFSCILICTSHANRDLLRLFVSLGFVAFFASTNPQRFMSHLCTQIQRNYECWTKVSLSHCLITRNEISLFLENLACSVYRNFKFPKLQDIKISLIYQKKNSCSQILKQFLSKNGAMTIF